MLEIIAVLLFSATILGILLVLGWLLLKRSQLPLSQVVAAMAVHAGVMVLLRRLLSKNDFEMNFPVIAICVLCLSGIGLFLGARNAKLVVSSQKCMQWVLFLTGMLVPFTVIAALIMLGLVFSFRRIPPVGILVWILMIIPAVTTVFMQIHLHDKLNSIDSSPSKHD